MKPLIEKRAARTTVGAIRWDAWYAHDGRADSVISQVERSLSPAKYHFRAPFYAEITAEGGIEIPDYTQADFDREMEYAIAAVRLRRLRCRQLSLSLQILSIIPQKVEIRGFGL